MVRVSGEMDMLIADKMRPEIDKRIDDKNIKNLVLNLEKVTFMDSSGLGLIIGRYKRISAKQGQNVYYVVPGHRWKRYCFLE